MKKALYWIVKEIVFLILAFLVILFLNYDSGLTAILYTSLLVVAVAIIVDIAERIIVKKLEEKSAEKTDAE